MQKMSTFYVFFYLAIFVTFSNAAQIKILVGNAFGQNVFEPNVVNASIGDIIHFIWTHGSHSVIESDAAASCVRSVKPNAFSSDGEFSAPKVFSTKITQEGKHWFYCGVPGHCESGMYGTLIVGNDDSGGTNNETSTKIISFFKKRKISIIIFLIIFTFLSICYIIAKIINQEGQNMLIFTIAFILFGFIMDLLFLFYDARKVPELYITSLVVLIVPFGLNVVFMTATIIHEIKTSEHNWFKEISTYFLALVIIVIGSDFDAWKLLESRIGNLERFNAPLSDTSKMFMLWCSIFHIFIKDIPLFVIQFLYKKFLDENYTMITFMIFVKSIIFLIIDLLSKGLEAIKHIKHNAGEDEKNHSVDTSEESNDYVGASEDNMVRESPSGDRSKSVYRVLCYFFMFCLVLIYYTVLIITYHLITLFKR